MAKQDGETISLQNIPHVDGVVIITSEKQATWGPEEEVRREEVGNLELEEVKLDKESVEIVTDYIFP